MKLILAIIVVPQALFAASNWVKFPGNPVMGSPELGTCFDLNVVPWGAAKYNNYFSWRSQNAIALSHSNDGIHWSQPVKCLDANPMSGWEDSVNRASVFFKDGTYHMWYCGQARNYTKIGYATSTDGIHFSRVRKMPVMIPEFPHEGWSVMNPYVRWDNQLGKWRMWYASGETFEPNVLNYAESTDGIHWEKSPLNPIFVKGDKDSWECDRVGGCEVHPLPDGRWVMFYIGYSDIRTARIGAAISPDGITRWKRLKQNPLVEPTPGAWDSTAVYKPSVTMENDRWRLWYNGRTDTREYIGMVEHQGLDLGPLDEPFNRVLKEELVRRRFDRFNLDDEEIHCCTFSNRNSQWTIGKEIPLFECPDEDIERTYYFRWWTYRKHLRRTRDGGWVVTEFMPEVSWAGAENTISCPFGHHLREGRWLRNPQYLDSYLSFMLTNGIINGPRAYVSWPAWGALERAKVTGDMAFLHSKLDDFIANFNAWQTGWKSHSNSLQSVPNRQDAGGGVPFAAGFRPERGLFDFVGNREGTEFALSADGARPMVNGAMWAEAHAIAQIAKTAGRDDVARRFSKIADELERAIKTKLWNPQKEFFTTLSEKGVPDAVCELHGYAPFYFAMPLTGYEAAWKPLMREDGFHAPVGLTFPARNTPGFDLTPGLEKHECLWNGPSWPYATSIALTALYETLQSDMKIAVSAKDFTDLLKQYAAQQVRTLDDGRKVPWIDENLDPFTGEWIARKHMIEWDRHGVRKLKYRERGKDYNHSTFCDLVIGGLCGFVPQLDGSAVVKPLAPPEWDWWCVDGIRYHGRDVTILFDRDGSRYGQGKGLVIKGL